MTIVGVSGMVFSYPPPAEDPPRPKASAPTGKDTGFFGQKKKSEIFGPQTASTDAGAQIDLSSSGVIRVASDGDVILELRGDSQTFRFSVASQVLCVASPYFRDMPGPSSTFKRACDIRNESGGNSETWTVVTLGDDPHALAILLYALHLQSEEVPSVVSFDQLWELAVLCDKYGCVSAMGPWIALWTREPPQHKDNFSKCLVKWLSMAQIFGRDDLFEKVTREIILEGRYFGRVPSDDHLALPSHVSLNNPSLLTPIAVISRIRKRRDKTYKAIIGAAMETKRKYETASSILCKKGSKVCDLALIGSMTREFQTLKIDSFSSLSRQEFTILELADAVKNVQLTFCDEPTFFARVIGVNHRRYCDPLPDLVARVDNYVSGCKGLGLLSFIEA